MQYPVYTTLQNVTASGIQRNVATLISGDPAQVVIFDNLDAKGRSDLDVLVVANGGTLPLSDITVAQNCMLNNGRSWYDTYYGMIFSLPSSFGVSSSLTHETYNSVIVLNASTSSTGTAFVSFPSQPCMFIDLVNSSGADIEYRRSGSGLTMTVKNGQARLIHGITNANQIAIRRLDQANSQLVVNAEAFVS